MNPVQRERGGDRVERQPSMIDGDATIRIAEVLELILCVSRPRLDQRVFKDWNAQVMVYRVAVIQDCESVNGGLGFIYPERMGIQLAQPNGHAGCNYDG